MISLALNGAVVADRHKVDSDKKFVMQRGLYSIQDTRTAVLLIGAAKADVTRNSVRSFGTPLGTECFDLH